MTQNSKTIFSKIAPKQSDAMYWVDLASNSEGAVIKYWDGGKRMWVPLLESTIGPVEDLVKGLQKSITTNSDNINDLRSAFTDLEGDLTGEAQRISDVEEQLNSAISATDAKIKALEERIVALEAK